MKNMKIGRIINNLLLLLFPVFAGSLLHGCTQYPEYAVNRSPYVDHTLLELYTGAPQNLDDRYIEESQKRGMFIYGKAQLTASPSDRSYSWRSEDESVAKISSTGMVEAVSEGLTVIYVSAEGMEPTKVDIRVRPYIPCTDFRVTKENILLFPKGKYQVFVTTVPENATGIEMWSSSNSTVASVYQDGNITGNEIGVATVSVKVDNIEKNIAVSIPNLELCAKTAWKVVAYSDAHSEGGGINTIIDGNYASGNYWHSMYSPNAALPHWAIIDMQEDINVARTVTRRRNNGDTKTIVYYVGDEDDPNSATWKKVAQGTYPASQSSVLDLTLDATELLSGRYLKLVVSDSYRVPFTAITEVDVYKAVF